MSDEMFHMDGLCQDLLLHPKTFCTMTFHFYVGLAVSDIYQVGHQLPFGGWNPIWWLNA